jgi:hypothetical protein
MLYKENSNEVVSGGSFMGEQFVDMFAKDKKLDISSNFLSFASGQEVIRKATGQVAKVVRPRKRARKLGSKETAWNLGTSPKVSRSLLVVLLIIQTVFGYRRKRKESRCRPRKIE